MNSRSVIGVTAHCGRISESWLVNDFNRRLINNKHTKLITCVLSPTLDSACCSWYLHTALNSIDRNNVKKKDATDKNRRIDARQTKYAYRLTTKIIYNTPCPEKKRSPFYISA